MRRRLKFEKEMTDWFVDLPEWEGPRADLQMVAGADTWLDLLCQGEWDVWMTISNEKFDGAEKLIMIEEADAEVGGAYYIAETYQSLEYNLKMWLCDVTKFVFGDFPPVIYYK
jgi:hypothetical protein